MRLVQFALSLGVATVLWLALREVTAGWQAALVALTAVAFVPFNVHVVNYDTLSCYLLTCGLFLAAWGRSGVALTAAGLCLGLAGFAYPPLVAVGAVSAVTWATLLPGIRRLAITTLSLAVLVPALGFGLLAAAVGPHQMVTDYSNTARFFGEAGGAPKLHQVITGLFQRTPLHSYTTSLQLVAHFGWLALLLYPFVRRRPGARLLLLGVWLPSAVAGLITAYSSANSGAMTFGIGFFPAFVVSTVFLVWALDGVSGAVAGGAVMVLLGVLLACGIAVYRDGPLGGLSARVQSGAFAGIYTTPQRRAYVDQIQADLRRLRPCSATFLVDLPAGYLLSRAEPDTNSSWIQPVVPESRTPAYRRTLLSYWMGAGFPQAILLTHESPYGGPPEVYVSSDPLITLLHRSYRVWARRPSYLIYVSTVPSELRCPPGRTATARHGS